MIDNDAINMYEKIKFTKDQKKGIHKIIKFLYTDNIQTYGLYGYAGTGKTTLIVSIVSYLLKNNYVKSIVLTAPTNKAVNIMKSKFRNELNSILKDITNNIINKDLNFEDQIRLLQLVSKQKEILQISLKYLREKFKLYIKVVIKYSKKKSQKKEKKK